MCVGFNISHLVICVYLYVLSCIHVYVNCIFINKEKKKGKKKGKEKRKKKKGEEEEKKAEPAEPASLVSRYRSCLVMLYI